MAAPVDPAPAAVTPPAEVTPPPAGPWAADAAEYFGDNAEAIASFDRYMREKQQPYITSLETDSAPARELYKDLQESPQETMAAVFSQLFEDDPALVEKYNAIWAADEPVEPAAVTPPADDVPAWAQPLVERDQAQREADAIKAGEEAYAEVLAELRAAHADLTDDDMELIHPFMASASDPESAYNGYAAYKAKFAAANGVAPAAAEAVTPPAVLGSDGAVAATPPITKKYANYDEAIDDFFAERRAAAPPVVGSV